MSYETINVAHGGKSWGVSVVGEHDVRSHHFTKEAAVYTGRALAVRMSGELVIHDTDGEVARRESYVPDLS